MALPSGHPQAFREKGLTQTLYLCAYLCGFAIILHYIKMSCCIFVQQLILLIQLSHHPDR